MQVPQIQSTKDYNIFKQVSFNRSKNTHHLQQLKKIILKENLLHLHPILVNEKMEVVDGQHRLEVAKELDLEIFFIQSTVSYDHILNSNLFQKKLSLEDVIKFYAMRDKNVAYIQFLNFTKELSISPKALIGLIFGICNRPLIDMIKSGKFDLPSNKSTLNILITCFKKFKEFVMDKRIRPFSMFSSAPFTIAFRNLILISEFDEEIFLSKLDQRWFELRPQLNSVEWTKLLLSIYNWKNHNPIAYGAA